MQNENGHHRDRASWKRAAWSIWNCSVTFLVWSERPMSHSFACRYCHPSANPQSSMLLELCLNGRPRPVITERRIE